MKTTFLLLILAGLTYLYWQGPKAPAKSLATASPIQRQASTSTTPAVIVAPAPSSYSRWKNGATAQNDWKTGPDAQTQFEPFAPSEQATWNQTPGYTIVSGGVIRR